MVELYFAASMSKKDWSLVASEISPLVKSLGYDDEHFRGHAVYEGDDAKEVEFLTDIFKGYKYPVVKDYANSRNI